jgi:BolA protein|tara:strand:- start:206 stop:460 length:255 start_codon:yes stop_codon:yes gene_type:complete
MIKIHEEIKKKINEKINPKNIILIDNSSLHKKHKSFDLNKVHLKIIIESEKLKKMNKIDAHKKIFSILKEEMKNKIHALEIEIK